ncbi:lamin tail domain-containing protein [Candidatus Gracilibacteria bacterium]|nr:lamin tail domain-containing protein [Candidatus Gracilibacteria bacterium]
MSIFRKISEVIVRLKELSAEAYFLTAKYMNDMFKKLFAMMAVTVMASQFLSGQLAQAAEPGSVVINEVAWAGSADSSNDEWIELYNNSNQPVDIGGWTIVDDVDTVYQIVAGVIQPRGFFLIEDSEQAVSNVQSDAIINMSLANTGDSLVLKDNQGRTIDTVNGNGGAWYAGNGANKPSMERIDPTVAIDQAANWASSNVNNLGLASLGSVIFGTPKTVNSVFAGEVAAIVLDAPANAEEGDEIRVRVNASMIEDLYAYGVDLVYNPNFFRYVRTEETAILRGDGAERFFQAALEDGVAGKVVVGASRLTNPPTGIDANGELFSVYFQVIGGDGAAGEFTLGPKSFASDRNADIAVRLNGDVMNIGEGAGGGEVGPVVGAAIAPGVDRYKLALSWNAPVGLADQYVIEKMGANGMFREIGRVAELTFVDGTDLVAGVDYRYRIFAVKAGVMSEAVEIIGREARGLGGDIDRSDRVDGRDIESLARSYGKSFGELGYQLAKDVNYDGELDGSDLITMGANFGLLF